MSLNYGFIGLGAMGYEMAKNVRQKIPRESTLFIQDVNKDACEKFAAECISIGRIEIVGNAREVADAASVIISIVPAASHVKSVYLDAATGVIAAKGSAERLILECSTIDCETAREVGGRLSGAGAGTYVDTPVSGGVPGAAAGTLAFLVGYPDPSAGQLTPKMKVLKDTILLMGSPEKLFFCGGLGLGLAAKIANNYLSGTNLLAAAEAANIGIRLGVDSHLLYRIIQNSTGQSFMNDKVHPVPGVVPAAPSSHDYKGGFKAQMMVKDMTLGVEAAKQVGCRATMGPAALEIYKEAAKDPRCIDRDVSVIWRFLDGPE
ncbi:3-hydroxyisobutyrate dehydrogenase-like protein [Bisporella sp. PMI_857]|nr:3-hydroxyisobutyrate dehydrogenase-like protein [Bisporella sp. PMI_857]